MAVISICPQSVIVNDVVIAEAYYALKYHYEIDSIQVRQAMQAMLTSGLIQAEPGSAVLSVLQSKTVGKAGFVDRLIHARWIDDADVGQGAGENGQGGVHWLMVGQDSLLGPFGLFQKSSEAFRESGIAGAASLVPRLSSRVGRESLRITVRMAGVGRLFR